MRVQVEVLTMPVTVIVSKATDAELARREEQSGD
jgi:hypothetical protein